VPDVLLFLDYVLLALFACCVQSVANDAGPKLWNASAVLATVHPVVLLHADQLFPRNVLETFFVFVALLALFACCVQSVANDAGLKLRNASAVLATVHPLVLLHADQPFPRHVLEPFFVFVARSMLPGFPLFELQDFVDLILLRAYDDLCLAFCEALCVMAL
jgi:hypothetical protein